MNKRKRPYLPYACFSDVLQEVRNVLVIDFAQHCVVAPKRITDSLKDAPIGVYASGMLEPLALLGGNNGYYSETSYQRQVNNPEIDIPSEPYDIVTFEQFANSKENIYHSNGKIVASKPFRYRHMLQETPSMNYALINFTMGLVWEYFEQLHPDTMPFTNLQPSSLDPRKYVKPEFHSLVDGDALMHAAFYTILSHITDFIGRDIESVYFLRFKNTTLYLEKGNDYRVIEFYRPIFDEIEKENEDLR